MENDAPYNEVPYLATSTVVLDLTFEFDHRPNLDEDEMKEAAIEWIRRKYGKDIDTIEFVSVYKK